jgi:hypothetical protein
MILTVPHRGRLSTIATGLAIAILTFGLILRVRQYVANRSLWYDEALLALNIADRTPVELIQPLDNDQGAPIGFLLLQKLLIVALGNRDYNLRIIPLAAGVLSLILLYKVASQYVRGLAILLALSLFAVVGPLIYYSSEAKQYASDVAVCLILLLIASRCLEATPNPKWTLVLGLAGSATLWISHPALFILMAVGVSLVLHHLANRDFGQLPWLGATFFAWLVSFLALYLVSLRFLASNNALTAYWGEAFMPMPPWRDLGWFADALSDLVEGPVGLANFPIAALTLLIGCLSLCSRRWQLGLVLALPFPLVLVASGLGKYPFGGRLLLFLVPLVLLLIAEGVEWIRLLTLKLHPWLSSGIWVLLAAMLLYVPVVEAAHGFLLPQMREHIKPVMSHLAANSRQQDLVYVYYGAQPAFSYYAPQYGFAGGDYLVGVSSRQDPEQYVQHLDAFLGRGRVWFVFSHVYNWNMIDEEAFFVEHLDKIGTRLDEFRSPGASTYLYDL